MKQDKRSLWFVEHEPTGGRGLLERFVALATSPDEAVRSVKLEYHIADNEGVFYARPYLDTTVKLASVRLTVAERSVMRRER